MRAAGTGSWAFGNCCSRHEIQIRTAQALSIAQHAPRPEQHAPRRSAVSIIFGMVGRLASAAAWRPIQAAGQ